MGRKTPWCIEGNVSGKWCCADLSQKRRKKKVYIYNQIKKSTLQDKFGSAPSAVRSRNPPVSYVHRPREFLSGIFSWKTVLEEAPTLPLPPNFGTLIPAEIGERRKASSSFGKPLYGEVTRRFRSGSPPGKRQKANCQLNLPRIHSRRSTDLPTGVFPLGRGRFFRFPHRRRG